MRKRAERSSATFLILLAAFARTGIVPTNLRSFGLVFATVVFPFPILAQETRPFPKTAQTTCMFVPSLKFHESFFVVFGPHFCIQHNKPFPIHPLGKIPHLQGIDMRRQARMRGGQQIRDIYQCIGCITRPHQQFRSWRSLSGMKAATAIRISIAAATGTGSILLCHATK